MKTKYLKVQKLYESLPKTASLENEVFKFLIFLTSENILVLDFKCFEDLTYDFAVNTVGRFYAEFPFKSSDMIRFWNCSSFWKLIFKNIVKKNKERYKKPVLKIT